VNPFRGLRLSPSKGTEEIMTKLLQNNEGIADRAVRIALGLGVLALAFVGPQTPFGYLGLIPLATGLLGSCPLYSLAKVSTCRRR
jgi:hypothetical protein